MLTTRRYEMGIRWVNNNNNGCLYIIVRIRPSGEKNWICAIFFFRILKLLWLFGVVKMSKYIFWGIWTCLQNLWWLKIAYEAHRYLTILFKICLRRNCVGSVMFGRFLLLDFSKNINLNNLIRYVRMSYRAKTDNGIDLIGMMRMILYLREQKKLKQILKWIGVLRFLKNFFIDFSNFSTSILHIHHIFTST